jgi:hypothetical protein
MNSFIRSAHRLSSKVVATMLTFFLVNISASAGSICKQTFTVYGKTTGPNSILAFREQIGGECESNNLFMILLYADSLPLIFSAGAPDGVSERVMSFLNAVGAEPADTVAEANGRFSLNDSVYFTLPPEDTTFAWKHGRLGNEGKADAAHWRKKCPVNCQDYPNFVGAWATLLYEHKRGLYKNYTVSQCLWYSRSDILVIVTYQPRTAVGMDTMHGILIYRLNQDASEGEL